ncbi:MAG: HAD family phosphatase [Anaerolineales bacterium]|nr:HAD family phosphatase [Anaerolineales bacterium]
MTIPLPGAFRAVYFDLGGVIVRTGDREPRTKLAERLGMSYDELDKAVFENESSARASLGAISTEEHWAAVVQRLGLPPAQADIMRHEFFAGDIPDLGLIAFIRSLRPKYRTGLISNAWPDMRAFLVSQNIADAFDELIISAEVGIAKPDARIYQLALEKLGVAPTEAVFVDDFARNIAGARAVGMYAIQFTQPDETLEELKQLLNNDG